MQISGCSAVVTGGTGGMGEATVRRLHAAGAKVVDADIAAGSVSVCFRAGLNSTRCDAGG